MLLRRQPQLLDLPHLPRRLAHVREELRLLQRAAHHGGPLQHREGDLHPEPSALRHGAPLSPVVAGNEQEPAAVREDRGGRHPTDPTVHETGRRHEHRHLRQAIVAPSFRPHV